MIKFLDLKRQLEPIEDEINEAISEVLRSGQYILGPHVEELEKQLAAYCQCKYAVGVSSGTDALLVSLMSLGIGPGDEVITSPYTFVATGEAIARTGATPVFVDVDETFNLNPSLVMPAVTQRTRVIIPVHSFGQCCDLSWVPEAHKKGILVIEDACQSIGSEWEGKRAGSIGDLGCFSFFPSKNLGCYADGGLVTTNNEDLYNKIKCLRNHGSAQKYYHKVIGGNFRLDELQAAILLVKFKYLDDWIWQRLANASIYNDHLIALQAVCPIQSDIHVFNQYVVRIPNRDAIRQAMKEKGIETEIYYPVPLHLQECFKYLGYQKGELPISELLASQALALPIYPELKEAEQSEIIATLLGLISGTA